MRWIHHILLAALLLPLLAACGDGGSNTAGPAVEVTIVYGSEKKAWMEDVTARFNAAQPKTTDGKQIKVTITPMGSADSLNKILNGEIQPTVWSPASAILLPVANEEWSNRNSGAQLVDERAAQLVLSPVVIAMWEPMAKALGWPQKAIGWADIAEFASSGRTWADLGRPEWGTFKFGHTHPDFSNSGITSILAIAYAAAGKTRGLTVADVNSPQAAEFMRNVQSGVIHYGESTGFFGTQMFTRGPSYLSAAVLYENLVVESYDRNRYPNLSLPVVAIYPREGTFWSDHPYAILNASWVNAEQRAAAEQFRDFLLQPPQQQTALQYGFRPAVTSVPLGAPLDAAHGVDPKQPQTLLEVPRPDVLRAIRASWGQNKKRVDVMAVLDVSGSMEEENRLETAKAALRTFVQQLSDDDGFGLTIFSNDATVLSPISPIGPKRQELLDRIGGLTPQAGTRLIDSVSEAYAALSAEPPGQRIRAIIVLTDGADNRSTKTQSELISELSQEEGGTSIKVFTIAYGTGTDVNLDLLRSIATASGAKSYESSPTNIDQVYRDIATFF